MRDTRRSAAIAISTKYRLVLDCLKKTILVVQQTFSTSTIKNENRYLD